MKTVSSSKPVRVTKVSITLDARDAKTLREAMEARRLRRPGELVSWLIRVGMRHARRLGASQFIDDIDNQAVADAEAMRATAGLPAPAGALARVISLDQWKGREETRS